MLFTDTFITDAGAELFARMTAGNGKVVWGKALTSNYSIETLTTEEINQLTDIRRSGDSQSTYTSSGRVMNAVVSLSDKIASIYCELTNEQYSGTANTFGVWAKLSTESDSKYVLVLIARCGTAAPSTVNPYSYGRLEKLFVDFSIQISAAQVASAPVDEHWYASSDALQAEVEERESLAARAVTTHSLESESIGDSQTILGDKTFADNVELRKKLYLCDEVSSTGYLAYIAGSTRHVGNESVYLDYSYIKLFYDSGDAVTVEKKQNHNNVITYGVTVNGNISASGDATVDGAVYGGALAVKLEGNTLSYISSTWSASTGSVATWYVKTPQASSLAALEISGLQNNVTKVKVKGNFEFGGRATFPEQDDYNISGPIMMDGSSPFIINNFNSSGTMVYVDPTDPTGTGVEINAKVHIGHGLTVEDHGISSQEGSCEFYLKSGEVFSVQDYSTDAYIVKVTDTNSSFYVYDAATNTELFRSGMEAPRGTIVRVGNSFDFRVKDSTNSNDLTNDLLSITLNLIGLWENTDIYGALNVRDGITGVNTSLYGTTKGAMLKINISSSGWNSGSGTLSLGRSTTDLYNGVVKQSSGGTNITITITTNDTAIYVGTSKKFRIIDDPISLSYSSTSKTGVWAVIESV